MSDSVRPHRRQPTRLPRPWDSPGKSTGMGCHFLLQCMKVESESEVAQCVGLLATPWTAASQAPPSMGFSRQEYWSGVALNFQKDICMQAQTLPRSQLREKAATTGRLPRTHYPCQPSVPCFHLSLRAEGASTVKKKSQRFAASFKSLFIRGENHCSES